MKLAMTGFHDLAMWVKEDPNTPLAIIPKAMEPTAHAFAARIELLKRQRGDAKAELSKAKDCITETIRRAAQTFIEEKGWDECPYMEADEPEGGCECPATQLLDEYSKWLFDGCSGCPLAECC
ncbi:hypothetical protein ACR42D_10570 [Desulfovibrio caledoniensis]